MYINFMKIYFLFNTVILESTTIQFLSRHKILPELLWFLSQEFVGKT